MARKAETQHSSIVLSEAACAAEDELLAAIAALGLRVDSRLQLQISRSRALRLLSIVMPREDVTIAALSAFVTEESAPIVAFELSSSSPGDNVVEIVWNARGTLAAATNTHPALGLTHTTVAALVSAGGPATTDRSATPLHLLVPCDAFQCAQMQDALMRYQGLASKEERPPQPSPGSGRSASAAMADTLDLPGEFGLGIPRTPAPFDPYAAGRPRPTTNDAVDVDLLRAFVFPAGQLHPRSSGRLLLVALYGPLTHDGQLPGGRGVGRPLSQREVNAMIDDAERGDVLSVFTGGSVLCDTAAVETEVRSASIRRLPDITLPQLDAMLVDLPRDASGRLSFHDLQARVLAARQSRVKAMGEQYPKVVAEGAAAAAEIARRSFRPAEAPLGRGRVSQRMSATALAAATVASAAGGERGGATPPPGGLASTIVNLALSGALRRSGVAVGASSGASNGAAVSSQRSKSTGAAGRLRPSAGFPKMTSLQAAREHEHAMHRNTHAVVELASLRESTHTAGYAATSVRLLRHLQPPHGGDRPPFDEVAPLRLQPRAGTYVPGLAGRL